MIERTLVRSKDTAYSVRMAESLLARLRPAEIRWHQEDALALLVLETVSRATGDPKFGEFVRSSMDALVDPSGEIRGYSVEDFNLDLISPGRILLLLYSETKEERYRIAIRTLREQLRRQPRTKSGGFWHKNIYPHQMWLVSTYMACPFLAGYSTIFGEAEGFEEAARQILLLEEKARDPHTGLLRHGWDESKRQLWANPETGCSPNFWGRAIGWYAMAVVDVLDRIPPAHPSRSPLIEVFRRLARALDRFQDRESGLWFQVSDRGSRGGNYLETSCSAMFAYALAKGARLGYLEDSFHDTARRSREGLIERMVVAEPDGSIGLIGTCGIAGLGGSPYREGSFHYYVSQKTERNDIKGAGPFILAFLEIEGNMNAVSI